MNNQEIRQVLKVYYGNNHIRLTSLIVFDLEDSVLTMTVKKPYSNMQRNESAFEAWAIILKSVFGKRISKVVLEIKSDKPIPINDGHYNRFLWRIHNFSQMYSWFDPGTCQVVVDDFMNNVFVKPIVNIPTEDRKEVKRDDGERKVESLFVRDSKPYYSQLKNLIRADSIQNQFPVGLFNKEIHKSNKIFTGGSSAIDMLGYKNDNIIHLIELKTGDNDDLGIISEFLFYLFIIYGTFISGNIKYPDEYHADTFQKYTEFHSKNSITEIHGHLLFEKIHPMIDKKVVKLLNDGLKKVARKKKGVNLSVDRIQYRFIPKDTITGLKKI